MATRMRAKLSIRHIEKYETNENITFAAVGASRYPEDGSDENNTFARWTPTADLHMVITNPALIGQFAEGEEYYVDFTPAAPARPTI